MGILRLYLAICVVGAHSNNIFPWANHTGREAVQIFYLISGFYMAHISTKYKSTGEFYLSRLIRIFTPYYFVLILAIMLSIFAGVIFGDWLELKPFISQYQNQNNGFSGVLLVALSNVTLFFQDWALFFQHNYGEGLSLTTNFRNSDFPLWKYLMIPQAWSVGIELSFYLFVPWFNRQKNIILFTVLLLSLFIRLITYEILGLNHDPWTYRFFPFELAIFILGILSNRLYHYALKLEWSSLIPVIKSWKGYCGGVAVLMLCIYASKKAEVHMAHLISKNYAELVSYFGWALFVPLLFIIFGKFKSDRYVGELSYPVYLSHLIIISCLSPLIVDIGLGEKYLGIVSAFVTVIFSLLIYIFVILPVDKRRYKISTYVANQISSKSRIFKAR